MMAKPLTPTSTSSENRPPDAKYFRQGLTSAAPRRTRIPAPVATKGPPCPESVSLGTLKRVFELSRRSRGVDQRARHERGGPGRTPQEGHGRRRPSRRQRRT